MLRLLFLLTSVGCSAGFRRHERVAVALKSRFSETSGADVATAGTRKAKHDAPRVPGDILPKCKDCDPTTWTTGILQLIAGLDRKANLGRQIQDVAMGAISGSLEMVNPLLAMGFSVLAGMIGWSGADPDEALVKGILEQVDKMISESLSVFARDILEADISWYMGNIQLADSALEWSDIVGDFNVGQFFNTSCFDNVTQSDKVRCRDYQLNFGRGEALVLELQFTELMVHSWLELWRLAGDEGTSSDDKATYENRAKDLEVKIQKASRCVSSHVSEWGVYRMKSEHFGKGTATGHRTRRPEPSGGKVIVRQGIDKILNSKYTGPDCLRGTFYRTKDTAKFEKRLEKCRQNWIGAVSDEMSGLRGQAEAIAEVVASF